MAGQVTCLIPGNRAHFPARQCQKVTVLSPGDFLAFYRQHQKDP